MTTCTVSTHRNGKKLAAIATGVQSDSDVLFVFSFYTFIHLIDIKKTAVHLTSMFLKSYLSNMIASVHSLHMNNTITWL